VWKRKARTWNCHFE